MFSARQEGDILHSRCSSRCREKGAAKVLGRSLLFVRLRGCRPAHSTLEGQQQLLLDAEALEAGLACQLIRSCLLLPARTQSTVSRARLPSAQAQVTVIQALHD